MTRQRRHTRPAGNNRQARRAAAARSVSRNLEQKNVTKA